MADVTCHVSSTFVQHFRFRLADVTRRPCLIFALVENGLLLAMEGTTAPPSTRRLLTIAKGDQSAESFEKTLSALAAKIAKTSAQSERLRKSARRLTVSWTLYGGFAYISALLIFTLVTGWRSWGPMEYSVVSGGPLMSAVRPRRGFADVWLDCTEFAVSYPPSTTIESRRARRTWTVYIKKRTPQSKS